MRKMMSVLAILLPVVFIFSCSDDEAMNDYEHQLIGRWVEDTDSHGEIFHAEFRKDGTGTQWIENYGVPGHVVAEDRFTWSATETTIFMTMEYSGDAAIEYVIRENKLYLSYDGDYMVYVRE